MRDNIQELAFSYYKMQKKPSWKTHERMKWKDDYKKSSQDSKLRGELNGRVGVLEKWKWVIIGGSIVAGFHSTKTNFYKYLT